MVPSTPSTPPRTLGPYELLQVLGRGSMGAVYLARRPGLDRLFALKLVRAEGDAEAEERLRREARLASRLDHPGIVPCLDVGADPSRALWWLAMEFVPGTTLAAALRSRGGPLEPLEAARLLAELADAVGAAHAAGVVHRDLKPANVLVDGRTGRPRVTDFGLARDLGSDKAITRTGDMVGTPAYMAPEQIRGGKADERSDVWGLGVIFFEMLTGTLPVPVEGLTLPELADRIVRGAPPRPSALRPDLPAPLEEVCLRALARDPAQRFPDGRALAAAARAATEAAVSSGSRSGLRAARGPASAAPLVALGVCVVALLAVVATLLVERGGRVPRAALEAAVAAARDEARAEAARERDAAAAAARLEAAAGPLRDLEAARAALVRVEAELARAGRLQAEPRARAGEALAWVERRLESHGLGRAVRAELRLILGRGTEVGPLLAPVPAGQEGLDLLALRVRLGIMARDRALANESAAELRARAPAGHPLHALADLALALTDSPSVEAQLARLRRAPPDEPAVLWLMQVLLRGSWRPGGDGRLLDELVDLVGRYLRLVPCDPQLLENRAVLLWARWLERQEPADLEQSLRDLLRSRDISPFRASDWLNPGICLVSLDEPRRAIPELEEALRQTDGPASERNRARTWLGNAWMRLGDEAQAARWWDEAVTTQRESATEMGEHLQLASPATRERFERLMQGVKLERRYTIAPKGR